MWEAAGSLGRGGARALYRRPLHALRASADDDRAALWLHFADDTLVSLLLPILTIIFLLDIPTSCLAEILFCCLRAVL